VNLSDGFFAVAISWMHAALARCKSPGYRMEQGGFLHPFPDGRHTRLRTVAGSRSHLEATQTGAATPKPSAESRS